MNASYTVGKTSTSSGIIAIGRIDTCPKTKQTNLGANNATPKPSLAADGYKFNIFPVDAAAKDCNTVYLQLASSGKYTGKYVAHSEACTDQGAFSWAAKSNSKTLQWQLKSIR